MPAKAAGPVSVPYPAYVSICRVNSVNSSHWPIFSYVLALFAGDVWPLPGNWRLDRLFWRGRVPDSRRLSHRAGLVIPDGGVRRGIIGIGHTAEPALSAAHPEWIFAGISSDCVVASSKYPHLRDQTGNSQPRASRACQDGPGVVTLPLSSWTDTSPRPT